VIWARFYDFARRGVRAKSAETSGAELNERGLEEIEEKKKTAYREKNKIRDIVFLWGPQLFMKRFSVIGGLRVRVGGRGPNGCHDDLIPVQRSMKKEDRDEKPQKCGRYQPKRALNPRPQPRRRNISLRDTDRRQAQDVAPLLMARDWGGK